MPYEVLHHDDDGQMICQREACDQMDVKNVDAHFGRGYWLCETHARRYQMSTYATIAVLGVGIIGVGCLMVLAGHASLVVALVMAALILGPLSRDAGH